jgi:hypothetical protein
MSGLLASLVLIGGFLVFMGVFTGLVFGVIVGLERLFGS